ncbi:MAG: T9SS type A sorting domain-containing protein [Bacteroidales bacterium]|nr:T9SS type A sorting domain-containing protein [Bacteroidales bacterium]
MKKISFLLLSLLIATSSMSQTGFETIIPTEDGVFREAKHVIETTYHGFLIGLDAQDRYQNDMLITVSSEGEVTKQLIFQIDNKNLKYCGLFCHPANEEDYLVVATLDEGTTPDDYIQKELAFIRFDSDLNIISQTVYDFGDDYVKLAAGVLEVPLLILEDDGTVTMVTRCQKTDGYYSLFARFTNDGEILKQKESDMSSNVVGLNLFNLFSRRRSDGSFGMIMSEPETGSHFYEADTAFNVTRIGRLTNLPIRVVENQQYNLLDTTYSYYFPQGTIDFLNDSVSLLTTGGRYIKHLGAELGWCNFIATIDDSLNVLDNDIWDIGKQSANYSTSALSAGYNAISVSNDAIFHCGVVGIKDHGHHCGGFGVQASTITVSKFDKELNLIWRRHYGGNGVFYDINIIQATEDGGCIMTGVYTKDFDVCNFSSYILKLNEDGYDAISENTESLAKPYFCYPNPAKDKIYIEFSPDVNCQSVEIYTLDGRMVETCHGASLQNNTIDISNLNSGVYLMKIRMADGKEFSEKIVKE